MRLHRLMSCAMALSCVFAGCSSASETLEDETGTTAQALTEQAGGVPVPAVRGVDGTFTSVWTGSASDLLVLDAYSMCTTGEDGAVATPVFMDSKLVELVEQSERVLQKFAPPPHNWLALRNDVTKNARPISGAGIALELQGALPARYDAARFTLPPSTSVASELLFRQALLVAGSNLCIARGLHEQLGLGASLLLPAADRRALVDAVRAHAQLAMLQLSDLATLLALPDAPNPDPHVKAFRDWFVSGKGDGGSAPSETVKAWARDLADATRLHVGATRELAALLSRSASAREPLPGSSALSSDDFSPAGWRARVLALLYGGDPLASSTPGAAFTGAASGADASLLAWPSTAELPVAPAKAWTAEVVRAKALAEAFGVVAFALKSGVTSYTSRSDLDESASAIWLYRDLEAAIRTSACAVKTATNDCAALAGADVTEPFTLGATGASALSAFRAYTDYGVTPADALALVRALSAVMPSSNATDGFHLLGATTLVPASSGVPARLRLEPGTELRPRSLVEAAAAYGRLGRHVAPSTVALSHARALTLSSAPGSERSALDAVRAMGAVGALLAVRDAATRSADASTEAVRAFSTSGALALVDAAVGAADVRIAPRLVSRDGTATGELVHQSGATTRDGKPTRRWEVRVRAMADDPFWSGDASEYTAYVAREGHGLMTSLLDPGHAHAELPGIFAILAEGSDTTVAHGAVTLDGPGTFTAYLDVAEGNPATFFMRRRSRRGTEFRALTGPMRLGTPTDAHGTPLAGDTGRFAFGGALHDIAVRTMTPAPWNPAEPAFDGFGRPRGQIPSLSHEASASVRPGTTAPSLVTYLDRITAEARASEAAASNALREVLMELRTNEQGALDVEFARMREVSETRKVLVSLCGEAAGNAGAAGDTEAGAACGVRFTTVNALGATRAELTPVCGAAVAALAPATAPVLDWQSTATCGGPGEEGKLKCVLDGIRTAFAFPTEVATEVACAPYAVCSDPNDLACLLPPSTFGSVGGALQANLIAQAKALRAYRDAVRELEAAGRIALQLAKIADESVVLAEREVALANERASLAQAEGMMKLAELAREVARTGKASADALTYLNKLKGIDVAEAAKRGMAAQSYATTGAAIGAKVGSVVPGVGTAIGAVVGGVGGAVLGWIASGPSEEELAAAQSALERAELAEQHAREAEADYARYLGVCATAPSADGSSPSYGPCPAPLPSGSLLSVYAAATSVDKQREVLARSQAVLAGLEATRQLRERMSVVSLRASELIAEGANLQSAVLRANLALEEARLGVQIESARQGGQFAISKAFHANSMWTAGGLSESARVALSDARLASEFVFATNLSSPSAATTAGARVGPSDQWADQIFDIDFSPLRVVGLSSVPPAPTTLSGDKLTNYVANLDAFNATFMTVHQVQLTPSKVDSAFLPGPGAKASELIDTGNGETIAVDLRTRDALGWRIVCPEGSACAPEGGECTPRASGALEDVCARPAGEPGVPLRPLGAKLVFRLDALGHVRGTPMPAAASALRNGRWSRFALNLTGGTIRDCNRAPSSERPSCTATVNTVGYTLRQRGPFVVTDASGKLRALALEPAVVGYGDAYDAGATIATPNEGLSRPGLSELVRGEFFGRPLEGTYELELHAGPYDDLGKLTSVQIVYEPTFWQSTR